MINLFDDPRFDADPAPPPKGRLTIRMHALKSGPAWPPVRKADLDLLDRAIAGRPVHRYRDVRPVTDPAKLAKLRRTDPDGPAPAGWAVAA